MPLWVIRIVAAAHPEDPPQFVPQLQPGGAQGLLAQVGDSGDFPVTEASTGGVD